MWCAAVRSFPAGYFFLSGGGEGGNNGRARTYVLYILVYFHRVYLQACFFSGGLGLPARKYYFFAMLPVVSFVLFLFRFDRT